MILHFVLFPDETTLASARNANFCKMHARGRQWDDGIVVTCTIALKYFTEIRDYVS